METRLKIATYTVRAPLFLEDSPLLFTLWCVLKGFFGAVRAHYLRNALWRGCGPPPSWWLSARTIRAEWRRAKLRVRSRFALLTWNCYPYRMGEIVSDRDWIRG